MFKTRVKQKQEITSQFAMLSSVFEKDVIKSWLIIGQRADDENSGFVMSHANNGDSMVLLAYLIHNIFAEAPPMAKAEACAIFMKELL